MADRDSAGSPQLPSTSRGNANRGLPSSSRGSHHSSGNPPPRPSTSRGQNSRGWQYSSRGVTPRFRNFCITNEHPDGIVFCEPDGSVADDEMPPNETGEVEPPALPPSPPLFSLAQSSSSSDGDSMTTSIAMMSSGRSSDSDNGTIIIFSSSEDEEDKVESKPKSDKTGGADKAQKKNSTDSEDDMLADENLTAREPAAQPQPEVGVAALVAVAENEVPEYLHHKKFHYKQVQAAAVARSKELNVNNLHLSAYITRDQAASRLKALGNLQETQKEIDDFAAIICAGNMYRLNLARGNAAGGSSMGHERQASFLSTTNSGNQLPAIAELHEGSKVALTGNSVAGDGRSSGRGERGPNASTSSAAMFQTAGTSSKDISIGVGNDSYPVAGMTSEKGSYFQCTSPGHVSDDYELISD